MIRRVWVSVIGCCLLVGSADAADSSTDANWTKERDTARLALQAQDYSKAEKFGKLALSRARKFKATDGRLLVSLRELGGTYIAERKFVEASPLYLQILKIEESKYGPDAPELIAPLNNVVRSSCAAGACYDTIPYLKRMLAIRRKTDPNSRDIPINLLLIGEAFEKREKYTEAVDWFRQAATAERERDPKSPLVRALASNIQRLHHKIDVASNRK